MKRIFVLLSLALMLLSCGEKMSVEKINELESKVFAKDAVLSS